VLGEPVNDTSVVAIMVYAANTPMKLSDPGTDVSDVQSSQFRHVRDQMSKTSDLKKLGKRNTSSYQNNVMRTDDAINALA